VEIVVDSRDRSIVLAVDVVADLDELGEGVDSTNLSEDFILDYLY